MFTIDLTMWEKKLRLPEDTSKSDQYYWCNVDRMCISFTVWVFIDHSGHFVAEIDAGSDGRIPMHLPMIIIFSSAFLSVICRHKHSIKVFFFDRGQSDSITTDSYKTRSFWGHPVMWKWNVNKSNLLTGLAVWVRQQCLVVLSSHRHSPQNCQR